MNIKVDAFTVSESSSNIVLFQEGYAKHTGEWSRVFFMAFYIVMMVGLLFACWVAFQN